MARLPESHSSTGAEPRGQPDPTNEVLVLCAGTVVRKQTCGTPTEWVAAALSFGNKHRNDHILAFHLREKKKGRLEVVCRSSCGTHLPACPWERPEQAVLGQSSWVGQGGETWAVLRVLQCLQAYPYVLCMGLSTLGKPWPFVPQLSYWSIV